MKNKFSDLKKQIGEEWKNLESRIQESNFFNLLKERYQSLSVKRQSIIKYFLLGCFFVILAYFPLSYFFSSMGSWGDFKDKYSLSLDLLKMRKKISSSPFRYSQNQIKDQIEKLIDKYSSSGGLLKDKKIGLPKEDFFYQVDFNIELKTLNIKQAIKLGVELNALPQARLSAFTMEESVKYPKYYDVSYRLSSFIEEKSVLDKAPKKRTRNKRDRRDRREKRKKRELKDRTEAREERKLGEPTREREKSIDEKKKQAEQLKKELENFEKQKMKP